MLEAYFKDTNKGLEHERDAKNTTRDESTYKTIALDMEQGSGGEKAMMNATI